MVIEEMKTKILYDPETGLFAWKTGNRKKPPLNAPHSGGYLFGEILGRKTYAHRAAWAMVFGVWPENEIDHINQDKTDNRICNLRSVGRQENAKNLSLDRRNKSGSSGVFKHSQYDAWVAQIRSNNKTVHLGTFKEISDAIQARKDAEIRYKFHKNHGSVGAHRAT